MTKCKRKQSEHLLTAALKGEKAVLLVFPFFLSWNADMMAGAGAAILNHDMEIRQ